MSAHWTTQQSSSAAVRTSTLSPVSQDTRSLVPPSAAPQLTWSVNSYDPFAGRDSQDAHLPAGAQAWPDQSPLESYHDTYQRTLAAQTVHDFEHLSLNSTRNLSREVSPLFGLESSPTHQRRVSLDNPGTFARSTNTIEHNTDSNLSASAEIQRVDNRYQPRRRPYNQDEFDGPAQLLPAPHAQQEQARAQALPAQPIHLTLEEQDEVSRQVNDILAHCAFHFVAKYQFPIPLERDKPRVRAPEDREWAEWAYLLKRLATKRRIPARVLFENQIKQFVTTLENSITTRQQSNQLRNGQPAAAVRPSRDDRHVLQMISSGIQVAKILMDSLAMVQLDEIYTRIERIVLERRNRIRRTKHEF